MIVTTGNEVEGQRIAGYIGIVRGIIVRSPSITQGFLGSLKQIVGGNIESYAKVCEAAREEAFERMIEHGRERGADAIIGMRYDATEFATGVTEVLAYGTAVKLQSAFFEACGPAGMTALQRVLQRAKELGLITILDAKRGDIASTAAAYADAAFRAFDADALTVNPYLGRDAVEPFVAAARRDGRGLFVLVRTSNPGAGLFQDLQCDGRPVYQHVANAVAAWNGGHLGTCGFGDVGAGG